MLVLSRKAGEVIEIGNDIKVTVVWLGPTTVRLGIEAPSDTTILRSEINSLFPVKESRIVNAYPCHQHGCQDCGKCTADELIAGAGL